MYSIIKFKRINEQNQHKGTDEYLCEFELIEKYMKSASQLANNRGGRSWLEGNNFQEMLIQMAENGRMTQ